MAYAASFWLNNSSSGMTQLANLQQQYSNKIQRQYNLPQSRTSNNGMSQSMCTNPAGQYVTSFLGKNIQFAKRYQQFDAQLHYQLKKRLTPDAIKKAATILADSVAIKIQKLITIQQSLAVYNSTNNTNYSQVDNIQAGGQLRRQGNRLILSKLSNNMVSQLPQQIQIKIKHLNNIGEYFFDQAKLKNCGQFVQSNNGNPTYQMRAIKYLRFEIQPSGSVILWHQTQNGLHRLSSQSAVDLFFYNTAKRKIQIQNSAIKQQYRRQLQSLTSAKQSDSKLDPTVLGDYLFPSDYGNNDNGNNGGGNNGGGNNGGGNNGGGNNGGGIIQRGKPIIENIGGKKNDQPKKQRPIRKPTPGQPNSKNLNIGQRRKRLKNNNMNNYQSDDYDKYYADMDEAYDNDFKDNSKPSLQSVDKNQKVKELQQNIQQFKIKMGQQTNPTSMQGKKTQVAGKVLGKLMDFKQEQEQNENPDEGMWNKFKRFLTKFNMFTPKQRQISGQVAQQILKKDAAPVLKEKKQQIQAELSKVLNNSKAKEAFDKSPPQKKALVRSIMGFKGGAALILGLMVYMGLDFTKASNQQIASYAATNLTNGTIDSSVANMSSNVNVPLYGTVNTNVPSSMPNYSRPIYMRTDTKGMGKTYDQERRVIDAWGLQIDMDQKAINKQLYNYNLQIGNNFLRNTTQSWNKKKQLRQQQFEREKRIKNQEGLQINQI